MSGPAIVAPPTPDANWCSRAGAGSDPRPSRVIDPALPGRSRSVRRPAHRRPAPRSDPQHAGCRRFRTACGCPRRGLRHGVAGSGRRVAGPSSAGSRHGPGSRPPAPLATASSGQAQRIRPAGRSGSIPGRPASASAHAPGLPPWSVRAGRSARRVVMPGPAHRCRAARARPAAARAPGVSSSSGCAGGRLRLRRSHAPRSDAAACRWCRHTGPAPTSGPSTPGSSRQRAPDQTGRSRCHRQSSR